MFKAVKQFFLRLFGKAEEQAPVQPRSGKKLTKAERKEIEAVIAANKRNDRKELSAQDSIPFQRMFPDGICRVTDTLYTKTVQFQNINYQLSQNEDKTAIFDGWCDFSTISTVLSTFSCPSSTWRRGAAVRKASASSPGRMSSTRFGRNTPICCKTSLPRGITASPRPST